jgi:hypothetical protein
MLEHVLDLAIGQLENEVRCDRSAKTGSAIEQPTRDPGARATRGMAAGRWRCTL